MCLAVPGRVVEVRAQGASRIGEVDFGGIRRPVCLDFVPEAEPGDYVVVHVGFALSKVNAGEAARTLAMLEGESP